MVRYFQAVASDFDGTLTLNGGRPSQEVIDALAKLRQQGLRVILVTGRILAELEEVFADVHEHVDAIIAENGCVLYAGGGARMLAAPVPESLDQALRSRGVNFRRGEVILAGSSRDRAEIAEEIHRQELDCQLVFNRSELMVLPAGATKGTGLFDSLGDLGISRHSVIGVGDAENDYTLLDVCEVGVAAHGAVDGLREIADVVLARPGGEGIVELLERVCSSSPEALWSRRWQVSIGSTPEGAVVSVPGSQTSVVICGNSGAGKSYTAGLLAERLMAQGYCTLVIDPEGDHSGLGRLRGVIVIDAKDRLPSPARLVQQFLRRYTSVVLDLSLVPSGRRQVYLAELAREVAIARSECGLPHWILADEAQDSAGRFLESGSGVSWWGNCLVSYRPELLDCERLAGTDSVILLASEEEEPDTAGVDLLCKVSGADEVEVRSLLATLHRGQAVLAGREGPSSLRAFTVGSRMTEHRRHLVKYASARMDAHLSFHFRDLEDRQVAVAGNMTELLAVLQGCEDGVLLHHAPGLDLSRWVREVISDRQLAERLEEVERKLTAGSVTVGQARTAMVRMVRDAYLPAKG